MNRNCFSLNAPSFQLEGIDEYSMSPFEASVQAMYGRPAVRATTLLGGCDISLPGLPKQKREAGVQCHEYSGFAPIHRRLVAIESSKEKS